MHWKIKVGHLMFFSPPFYWEQTKAKAANLPEFECNGCKLFHEFALWDFDFRIYMDDSNTTIDNILIMESTSDLHFSNSRLTSNVNMWLANWAVLLHVKDNFFALKKNKHFKIKEQQKCVYYSFLHSALRNSQIDNLWREARKNAQLKFIKQN